MMTTIAQAISQKTPLGEPLRTLATYRQRGRKLLFGQNVTGFATGSLRVGDVVVLG